MIIKEGKHLRVGFTCSSFDLCHAGHLSMLEEAKAQCDWLIVGLQTDPTIDRPSKNRPVETVYERYMRLRACKYVDEIIPYSTEADLIDILSIMPIDVRILGDEYQEKDFTGRTICVNKGIKMYFNKRKGRFSSSELRQRIAKAEQEKLSDNMAI